MQMHRRRSVWTARLSTGSAVSVEVDRWGFWHFLFFFLILFFYCVMHIARDIADTSHPSTLIWSCLHKCDVLQHPICRHQRALHLRPIRLHIPTTASARPGCILFSLFLVCLILDLWPWWYDIYRLKRHPSKCSPNQAMLSNHLTCTQGVRHGVWRVLRSTSPRTLPCIKGVRLLGLIYFTWLQFDSRQASAAMAKTWMTSPLNRTGLITFIASAAWAVGACAASSRRTSIWGEGMWMKLGSFYGTDRQAQRRTSVLNTRLLGRSDCHLGDKLRTCTLHC